MRGATDGPQFPCSPSMRVGSHTVLDFSSSVLLLNKLSAISLHQLLPCLQASLFIHTGTGASSQLKDITLPEGTAELIPGANPDFHAKELVVRMSSPVKPEATWCLELQEPFTLSVFSSAGASSPQDPATCM